MTSLRVVRSFMTVTLVGFLVGACESTGETHFGKPCETSADCTSDFCVGGEAGTTFASFCSDDCTGRQTGDPCGDDGRGKCVADFVSWCWMPCTGDDECVTINPERPVCSLVSSSGVDYPFMVCTGIP